MSEIEFLYFLVSNLCNNTINNMLIFNMYLKINNKTNLQNSTRTFLSEDRATSLKFFPTSTLTGFLSQSSGISALIKNGFNFPSKKDWTKLVMVSLSRSLLSGTYLVISPSNLINLIVGASAALSPKNSITRPLSSTSVSM